MSLQQKQNAGNMGSGGKFFFKRIFPLIFIIAGLAASAGIFKVISIAQESKSWPEAEGVIRISKVQFENRAGEKGMYSAEVMFEYQIEGKTYSNNRISSVKSSSSNPASARETVDKYPEGAKVKVFYNSGSPQTSLLEPGVSPAMWLLVLIGPLFMATGIAMLILLPKLLDDGKERNKDEYKDLQA
jgi:hypothetical protein